MSTLRRAALVAVTLLSPAFVATPLDAQLRVPAPNSLTPINGISQRRGALCTNGCIISAYDGGFARLVFEDVSPQRGDLRIRATLTVDKDDEIIAPNGQGGNEIVRISSLGLSSDVVRRRVNARVVLTATNPNTGQSSRNVLSISASSDAPQSTIMLSGTTWADMQRRFAEVGDATQVYNEYKFQVSEIIWESVDLGGIRYVDDAIRRRLAARASAAEDGAVGAPGTAGAAGTGAGTPGATAGRPGTSGTTPAAASGTDTRTSATGTGAAAGAPRRLPPQPIPYDREAAAEQERRVLEARQREHDELAARYRAVRQEQARRQEMANRAVEAAVGPLVAVLEARERERKAAEIRAAARQLTDALANTERRVQESIAILEEDEQALTAVLASHPNLPAPVREAIEADLERLDEARRRKLQLVEEHAAEIEKAFIEGNEEPYNGDLTRVNRRIAINFVADGRNGIADGVITLSAEAVRAVMAARIPEGRQYMILQQLSAAIANSAARTCTADRIIEATTPYVEFGGNDSRMLRLTDDARQVIAYQRALSGFGDAAGRVRRRLSEEYGTLGLQFGQATRSGRAGTLDRIPQDVEFLEISGEVDVEAMIRDELGGPLPTRPTLQLLACDLQDAETRFSNILRFQERYIRPGPQTAYFRRPFSVPARLAVPVTVVAGEQLSLRPDSYRSRFSLDPHLAGLGTFQGGSVALRFVGADAAPTSRFSVNETPLRGLQLALRPDGYVELRTEFGQRLIRTARYMRGETTPYFGITYASAGAMFRRETDILRAFGSESKTTRSFTYFTFGGIEPNVGLMRRVRDRYHARLDVNVPLLQLHSLNFARTRTVDGVQDLDEKPSVTAMSTLAPTLSFELRRITPRLRLGLRYAFSYYPIVELDYDDEDSFPADDRAFAEGFFEKQLRHAFTFTVSF